MNSPGYSNDDRRPAGDSAQCEKPLVGATNVLELIPLTEFRMPSVAARESMVNGDEPNHYAIPEEQRQAFNSLLETLAAFQSPRPLILRTNSGIPELPALLETARSLASECASSMAENRLNAVRFVEVLRDFLRENPHAVKSLKAPMAECYAPLEKAIDSKVLELKPSSGVDLEESILSMVPGSIASAFCILMGALTQNMSSPLTTLGWLGTVGLGTTLSICVFRRSLVSLVRGGLDELQYTKAILNLRACLKETDR
jgi:hypothetical protein